ncbi:MAG: OmpA family protein [Bacteroidales bacterium]|nr:OmpA family protein [Bacteroidales bacterium]MDD4384341.1 OmpA family protein [Bacteroidales bacterium]
MKLKSLKKGLTLCFWLTFVLTMVAPNTNSLYAQNTEPDYKTLFTDAEYYFLFNDFQEALPLYLKALDKMPSNANLYYRIGRCYLNIPGLKHKSISFLEMASKHINPLYQEGSYKEAGAPQNVLFYLAEANRIQGNLDEAIAIYTKFKEGISPKEYFDIDYVTQQIEACKRAKIIMKEKLRVNEEKITLFDSESYLLTPAISANGEKMVFTQQEKFYDAIYISEKDKAGKWGDPINITLDLAIEGSVYSTSINFDGTKIFLFKNDGGTGNIYTSEKKNGKWEKAVKMGKPINSRSWETFASISPDGKTLFFSTNRKGGKGGLDIYYSNLKTDGNWGNAINIGESINTPFNEESPYLTSDGKTLFFISQGHNSIGGYDIFYSEKVGEDQWSAPTNMGYPINTPDDEMTFFPLSKTDALVSQVTKNNPNVRQIKKLSISTEPEIVDVLLAGKVTLDDNSEISTDYIGIEITNSKTNKSIAQLKAEEQTGNFSIKLPTGTYILTATAKDYTAKQLSVVIPETFSQPEYPISINLIPNEVTSGEYHSISSILFDFNKYELKREALFELEKLYAILLEHPSVKIEVCGHTDSKGAAAYNFDLSLKRANAVINYIVAKGINSSRFVARGAGAFENVAANYKSDGSDNPEGRCLNRRASVMVIKSDKSITISSEITVPDQLKPREQLYTILLAPINSRVEKKSLNNIKDYSKLEPKKIAGHNNQQANTIGIYEHKSHALELLNFAIDNGFPKSTIIGVNDLSMLIGATLDEYSLPIAGNLTIQIMPAKNEKVSLSTFKGLEVNEVKMKDGYIYTFGRFNNKTDALEELERVKTLGFRDALIVKAESYQGEK